MYENEKKCSGVEKPVMLELNVERNNNNQACISEGTKI